MHPVLTIVDDFLHPERWREMRESVLEKGFSTVMVEEVRGNPKVPYENVNLDYQPDDFAERMPQLYGKGVKMFQSAFRLGFEASQLHNLVHADHCCASLAAVYYMNPLEQCKGGTAFWRHKMHGWEMMPTQEQLDEAGYTLEELGMDWHEPDAWTMVSLAGMRTNRLITYPTHAFHSRWPWEGFGDKNDPRSARLIWCGFFDLV